MIKKSILLIGGSGNLGSKILNSNFFKKIYSPKKKELDLLNRNSISKTIKKKKFEIIINCAALARIKDCEKINLETIKKFENQSEFNEKLDELNQETDILIKEIDKWQT